MSDGPRFGFRTKVFAVALLVVSAVGLGVGLVLENLLRDWLEGRTELELLHSVQATRDFIQISKLPLETATLDPIIDRLGESMQARLTIVALDGRVIADSKLSAERIASIDNHAGRPEIIQALREGHGSSRRYSTSVNTRMFYVAMPLATNDASDRRGIARASVSVGAMDAKIQNLRLMVLFAGLIGLGLVLLLAAMASHMMTQALADVVQKARSRAQGERTRAIFEGVGDGFSQVDRSFRQLSKELDTSISALAEERDRLQTILQGMSEAVLAFDAEQRIVLANAAAIRLFALQGQPNGRLLVEAVRIPGLVRLVEDGLAKTTTAEFEMPQREGSFLAHVAPLRATAGCVLVAHDISEIRRLERIRRDFVANVSHELRTPVSVIQANTETLLGGALEHPVQARKFIEASHRNATRLAGIIADLLDLARIEAEQRELNLHPVALESVVLARVSEYQTLIQQRQLQVRTEIPDGCQVLADTKALNQVVQNLLQNALSYAPTGGHVVIRALAKDADTLLVEVEDDGPGIEPKHRDRVFERFYRVDPGRSRALGGTGLGLSIVKHLVAAMGGEVGLRAATPHGCIFWFSLTAT